MGTEADPDGIRSLTDLKAAFDVLRVAQGRRVGKERLSVRDLARRVERSHGCEVPRSTLANYLSGRTLPPPGVYESILRALRVDECALAVWADARDRLSDSRRKTVTVDSGAVIARKRFLRRRARFAVFGIAALATGAVTAFIIQLGRVRQRASSVKCD